MSLPPVVSDPLFFLDYDGTLAPIVPDPLEAYPHPDVPALLESLSKRFPMWIVTGRYMQDLERFLDRPYPAIGLHGMQEGVIGGETRELIDDETRRALDAMRSSVPEIVGLKVEPKGPTFAVHYRDVSDEESVIRALEDWASEVPSTLDVIHGKKVFEIRPLGVNKGAAVRKLLAEVPHGSPIYLGDDVTDEDAFAALESIGGAITIRVGSGDTRAKYRLDGPDEVVAYLQQYL
jgi:trehalose 6-phosphate phosphatase